MSAKTIQQKLIQQNEAGLLRTLKHFPSLIDFSSNDYLGLARSQELFDKIRNVHAGVSPRTNGSTGSRLLSGNSRLHEETEDRLAHIFHAEATLLFNSGYTANLAILSALPQRGDTILYDELIHASLRDGARLSLANRYSFRHNDLDDLEKKLQRARRNTFVVIESVYSMDGDVCPLRETVDLASRYGAAVILDEAHSTGIMGTDGSGMAISEGIASEVLVRIYTFGKAMGIHGACIAGSTDLKRFLVNFARPFIYTTAPDNHTLASVTSAFDFLKERQQELQNTLRRKIDLFRSLSGTLNLTPIHSFLFPGNEHARSAAAKLQSDGFDVRPILSPTVASGSERIRVCLHTFNTDEEIRGLANSLRSMKDNPGKE